MALIQYLTQIQIDFGARRLLTAECERVGITRPLVVTDAGVRAAGVLRQAARRAAGRVRDAVFDGTPSNPTEAAVRAAAALFDAARLRRPDRGRRRLVASTAPRASPSPPRHDGPLKTYATIEGGSPKITERVRAADRGAHHRRHRQRGRARRDRDRRRRAQARLPFAGTCCPRPPSATPS